MSRKYKVLAAGWLMLTMALSISTYAGKDHGHGMMVVDKFKMMDTDRNMRLSPEEHSGGATQMWTKMDLNKDGNVSSEEITAMQGEWAKKGKHMKGGHMPASQKIAKADKNGDGILSKDEHTSGTEKMFSEADHDKDGFLTLREMQDHHDMEMKHSSGNVH